jgi:hypothetical protein
MEGARGSVVGWGTMLQAGRSRVRVPMRWNFSSFQPHSSAEELKFCALWTYERLRLIRTRRISYSTDRRLFVEMAGKQISWKVRNTVTYFGCDYRRGMYWRLDVLTHLYATLGTTSNYSAIVNLHSLKITTVPAKPFPRLLCLHKPFPGDGL